MAERSGLLTFIFVWYLLGALVLGLNVFGLIIRLFLAFFFATDIIGFLSLVIVIQVMLLAIVVVFLVKLWSVDPALKRWTDVLHLVVTVLLVGTVVASLLVFPEVILLLLLVALILLVFFALLTVNTIFWILIRSHLARLEREGRAQFAPGLFNERS